MSKKTENFNFDDDDFSFDMDDTASGGYQNKKSGRARQAIVEFGGSFVSGLKQSFLNPSNQRKMLSDNTPDSFVAAFDAVSLGARSVRGVYRESKEEFFKELGDVENDVKLITSKAKGKLPARLIERIEAAAEKTSSRTYAEPDEEEELGEGLDAILSSLNRSNKQSMLVNKKASQDSADRIVASQASTTAGIITTNKILSNISLNSDKLTGIGMAQAKLARKGVELTFKQMVIQRQMLDVLQQTKEMQQKAFESIIKNTALPDAVKINLWEVTNRTVKQKLIGMATERVTAGFGNMFQRAVTQMAATGRQNAANAGMGLNQAIGGAATYLDMQDLMGSRSSQAGKMAGGIAGWYIRKLIKDRFGDKAKNNPMMNMYGNNISNFMTAAPGMWDKLQNEFGVFRRMTDFLGIGDIMAEDKSLKSRVRGSGIKDLDELQAFNRKSQIALTEVIPGELNHLNSLVNALVTGNKNAPLRTYDWEKGVFTTQKDLKERTLKSVFNRSQISESRGRAHQIVNSLDSKNELSKKDRAVLFRYVLKQADSDVGYIDPDALSDPGNSPIREIDQGAADRIADVLSNRNNFNNFGKDAKSRGGVFSNTNRDANYQAKMHSANEQLKSLRLSLPNGMSQALAHANTGNIQMLADAGLVSWDSSAKEWQFNNDKFLDAIQSGKLPPGLDLNSSGTGRSGPPGGSGGKAKGRGSITSILGMSGGNNFSSSSPMAASQPDVGVDGYTQFQRDLLESIELNSPRNSLDVSNQLLEAIRQRLDMGIPQGGEADNPQEVNRKSRLFRRLMNATSRFGRTGKSWIKNSLKAPMKMAAMPFKIFSGAITGGINLFRGSKSSIARVISSKSSSFADALGDIYIQGKESAAIKLADLQAGKYYDKATSKVIKTFKDIKGAIVDANGNEVVTDEDYKNGIYTILDGKRKSIVGGALRVFGSLISSAARLNTAPLRFAGNIVKRGLSMLSSVGKDIYVTGETSPRLLSRVMAAGGYFNKNGTPIKSIKDIVGDVVDSEGNVILSVFDLSKGLVDRTGKRIRSIGQRIAGALSSPFRMAKNMVMGAAKGAWNLAKLNLKALKLPGKLGSRISAMMKSGKENSPQHLVAAHTATTVDAIYALLQDRLPKNKGSWNDRDGSGFRDGSREDILANRDKAGDKKEETPEKNASNERRGMLGMLMAMVGGIGTLVGTVRSWFGNIFGMMRMAAQTKMATSAFDAIASIAGRGRRGRRGAAAAGLGRAAAGASMLTKLKRLGGLGKLAGLGGIAAGTLLFANSAFAKEMGNGATALLTGSDSRAYDSNNLNLNDSGPSGSSGDGGGNFVSNMVNGIGGSVAGELAAIASFPLIAGLYSKMKKSKLGGRILPNMQHGVSGPVKGAGKMSNAWRWLSGTTKGRMLLAAITGGALIGGQHALGSNKDVELGDQAGSSYLTTMGMDLAMATAIPALAGKAKGWWDARKLAKANAMVGPRAPIVGGPLASQTYRPTVATPGAGVMRPGVPGTTMPKLPPGIASAASHVNPAALAAAAPAAGKLGLLSKIGRFGKGVFGHAGLLGTGFAAYDAATTEGNAWDKTKAFGSSLLQTAAISKGLSMGGKLFSAAGRQAAMQGLRTGAAFVGRQALMQGARTALVGAGSAIAGFVSAPVLITAAVVAAVGIGAYFAYKKFYGTDKAALMRFRMAQYGIDSDNEEQVGKISALESIAKKYAKVNGDKAAFVKNIPTEQIIKIFGIAKNNKDQLNRFISWFTNRFRPVFLRGYAAYMKLKKTNTIEKADEMSKEEKLKFLAEISSLDQSAYNVLVLPFADSKPSKYDAAKMKKELDRANEKIGHERGKGEKSFSEKMSDGLKRGWDKVKSVVSDGWSATKQAFTNAKDFTVKAFTDPMGALKDVKEYVKKTGRNVMNDLRYLDNKITDGVSNFVASMTGSQKQWQMAVYNAFKKAGFAEQQARILTAEIGRENAYNPKYLFGGHADPHKGTNMGMLSWQGDRKTRLIAYLSKMRVLTANGGITQNQAGLDAQAQFIMWELRNTHAKVGNDFLANPNISYADGAYMVGKRYILWRIDDPKYSAAGKKNRDGFYNMLLKQLGAGATSGDIGKAANQPGSAAKYKIPPGIARQSSQMVQQAGANTGVAVARPGAGVLLPQYSKSVTQRSVPAPLGVGAIASGNIPSNHRAVKAATYATQKAHRSSQKKCASYVANALEAGGYKFVRQTSAYMYANGPLASAGFVRVNSPSYQIGDVMVWPAHGQGDPSGGAKHGHIQIYNGRNWVSDFIQVNMVPGQKYNSVTPSLWRDSTLIGKHIEGSVKPVGATPSSAPAGSTTDKKAPAAKAAAAARPAMSAAHSAPIAPSLPPTIARPSSIVAQRQTSSASAASVSSTRATAEAASSADARKMIGIHQEQLNTQRNMLSVLEEIRANLAGNKPAPADSHSGKGSTAAQLQRAADMFGSKTASPPVSMDIS